MRTTAESAVVFQALVTEKDLDPVQLQIEWKPIGTPFDGTVNLESPVLVEQQLHMHCDERTVLIQPKLGVQSRFDFDNVPEVVRAGEEEASTALVRPCSEAICAATSDGLTSRNVRTFSSFVSPKPAS